MPHSPSAPRHPARVLMGVIPVGVLLWFAQFTVVDAPTWQPLLDLVLGAGAITLVVFRRRWPFVVAVLTVAATAGSGLAYPAAVVAFVTLVITRRWRAVAVVTVIGVAAGVLSELIMAPNPESTVPLYVVPLAVLAHFGLLTGIGVLVASRRDLAAARLEQVRSAERTRIAREMHDVLAHRVSLVALHAGAMSYRTDLDAEELRSSARLIHDNAQRALGELRDVLGVLRDRAAGSVPEPPQPSLDDLPALLADARAVGPVELCDERPAGAEVSATVGRTAYRIVQEGLTNARKHAPGAPVRVVLAGAPGRTLRVAVNNPAPVPTVPALPGARIGLVGLGERVTSLGGRLRHGVDPDGEHRLEAELPWTAL